jgi:TonB-linked SusC/RagA family outer membrane protein
MTGMQFEKGSRAFLSAYKTNLLVEDVPSLQTAVGDQIINESLSQSATSGYFTRFTYNYKSKYLFEANARYDGSYVFRETKRWGFFPSFSVGWNIHEESFWGSFDNVVNAFKIRGSWGQLGNQNVSPFGDIELIPLQTNKLDWIFGPGETRHIGYATSPNLVNRNLTWETATTKNIGLNLSFLSNKLQTDFDLFERITTDMIGPSEAKPGVLGASVPKENNATLRTRGWELAVRWKQSFQNGVSYFINFNLYDNKSVVTKYNNPTNTLSTWYNGKEVGEIWGYTVNDLFRTQEEVDQHLSNVDQSFLHNNWRPGDLKYEDINGDGLLNNGENTVDNPGDLSIIGNNSLRYQYGISAGLDFKGIYFNMLWRGVGKRDLYFNDWAQTFWGFHRAWFRSSLTTDNLDYFRDQPGDKYTGLYEGDENLNTDAFYPRPYLNDGEMQKNLRNPTTRYLQNGSYIRLQNIQLGYSIPQSIVTKLRLSELRIFFSGENLLTFSKLPDRIDPVAVRGFIEGSRDDGVGKTYGADRVYSFGISIRY